MSDLLHLFLKGKSQRGLQIRKVHCVFRLKLKCQTVKHFLDEAQETKQPLNQLHLICIDLKCN